MSSLNNPILELEYKTELEEYITALSWSKIAWSKDGEYLAVSSLDNIIFVWGGGNLVPWRWCLD